MDKLIPFKNDPERGFIIKENGEVYLQFCKGAATHFSLEELRKVITTADRNC